MSWLSNAWDKVKEPVTTAAAVMGNPVAIGKKLYDAGSGAFGGAAPSVDQSVVNQNQPNEQAAREAAIAQMAAYQKFVESQSANAPQLQNAQTMQSRNEQLAALNNLRMVASGQAPSAAALQMQQGSEQAIAQQLAAANSARGGFNPAAIRQAQMAGLAAQQQNIQNTGILRAQEMAQAQQAYANQANALSQTDYNFAGAQAQLNANQRDYLASLQNQLVANRAGMFSNEMGGANSANNLATQIAIANQNAASAKRQQDMNFFSSILQGAASLGGLAAGGR